MLRAASDDIVERAFGRVCGGRTDAMNRALDNPTVRRIVALLLLLGLWETASRLKWIDPFYAPAPSAIGKVLFSLFAEGQIWTHLEATFSAAIMGLVAGLALGIVLGFV